MILSKEVWLVDFAPQVGQEIAKIRPAVVVNHDSIGSLKLKVVVPITDALKTPKQWLIGLSPSGSNGLTKESMADCFQIKSISEERFSRKIGELSSEEFDAVKLGLILVLDLF
ncbi:MAG: type II toxin-antitoxin system PemK/MazF family toxin [Algoriphagus aquaeductus]|uniref:type II toxin-antitoxin system PemK/MazF family toxin n=1 Tax=Algoriphagus aquaeductus TaxID=475299 RepID=UPI00391C58A3